jgi:AcrR family transcriptional regulator
MIVNIVRIHEQCSRTASGLSSTLFGVSSGDLPPMPRLAYREAAASRRAPRQRTLSRELIIDAALAIVDRDGLDALTMRSVAQALGTGAASLYAHVASKDELVELLVERVIGEVEYRGEPDPERWQEQVKATAREMRRVFARHGDLARASFARIPLGENALRGAEWMISVLRAGGLPDQVIAWAVDMLSLYVMAVAYEESLFVTEQTTHEQMAEFAGKLRGYFTGLPGDRFPNVIALAGELTGGDREARFEFGLEVVLRGLAAIPPAGAREDAGG